MIELAKPIMEAAKEISETDAKGLAIPKFENNKLSLERIGESNQGLELAPLTKEIPDFKQTNLHSPESNGELLTDVIEVYEKGETDLNFIREHLPESNGQWNGEKGDSVWEPDSDYIPGKSNPDEKTWGEILEENGIEGVQYKDGEPDFSPISEGTVEIDDFSDSRPKNYAQADEKLAEQWNEAEKDGKKDWTSDDIRNYREENSLTWHERSDMKSMDLVKSEVHNNVPHSGGISEYNKQNPKNGEA